MCSVQGPSSDQDCPVAKAAQLVGDVWTIMIINKLLSGPKRFCELENAINDTEPTGDISTRTLSQRLKMMESTGLINHITHKLEHSYSEYSLTEKGQALSRVIDDLRVFGNHYLA